MIENWLCSLNLYQIWAVAMLTLISVLMGFEFSLRIGRKILKYMKEHGIETGI